MIVAEHVVFGYDHALVGSRFVDDRRLPADIIAGIHGHHDPESGDDGEIGDLIHIAEILSHALDLGQPEHSQVPEVSELAQPGWASTGPDIATHFPEIEARYEGMRRALGL